MKSKAYVCALTLLSAVAACILCLSSSVTSPPSQSENLAGRNSKLEIGKLRPVGLQSSQLEPAARARLVENYGRLPLRFEANTGQTDSRVKFLSRGRGYTMFLTGDEAVLALRSQDSGVRSQDRNWKLGTGNSAAGRLESGNYLPPSLLPSPDSLMSGATHKQQPATHSLSFSNLQSSIFNSPTPDTRDPEPDVLRLKLLGANPKAKVTGLDELPGKSNYFIGNDPKKWRTNVSSYASVKYQGVYPGIDVIYYGSEGGQLEYDFVVAPGADPNMIAFDIVGAGLAPPSGTHRAQEGPPTGAQQAAPLRIDAAGDLVIPTDSGDVRFHKPVVYQPAIAAIYDRRPGEPPPSGAPSSPLQPNPKSKIENPKSVDGRFVLTASNQVRFELGSYDKSLPLVIDPFISYMAYYGGRGGEEPTGVARDAFGNTYVTGSTTSDDFPIFPKPGAFQEEYGGPTQQVFGIGLHGDAFVAKINPAGDTLLYSTYIGGSGDELSRSIFVDSSGRAIIAGSTSSGHPSYPTTVLYPTTDNAYQKIYKGGFVNLGIFAGDGFVTLLNAAGDGLVYSTYLGGTDNDDLTENVVDDAGNIYVTGQTASFDFPTKGTALPSQGGAGCNGGGDIFISKLNPNASGDASLSYSSYIGGSGDDWGDGIALDSSGIPYIVGHGSSVNFPVTSGAFQEDSQHVHCTGTSIVVAKINPDAVNPLLYSTYISAGLGTVSVGSGIAVDSSGMAYVVGGTTAASFPVKNAISPTFRGGPDDVIIAKLNPASGGATDLIFSTFLGGSGIDRGSNRGGGISLDPSTNNVWVTGHTTSTDTDAMPFPITSDAFQPRFAVGTCSGDPQRTLCFDAFVTSISADGSQLLFSTYMGGTKEDFGMGLSVDAPGNVSLWGETDSEDFLVTVNNFNSGFNFFTSDGSEGKFHGGSFDAFVLTISPGLQPKVGVSQISETFSDTAVGTESAPTSIEIGNFTSAPLDVTNIEVKNQDGTPSTDFTVLDPDGCNNRTFAVGERCKVDVTFSPTASTTGTSGPCTSGGSALRAIISPPGPPLLPSPRGTKTGALALTATTSGSAPKQEAIPLAGCALFALASFDPTALTFDARQVGTTSNALPVTLSNPGEATLTITSVIPNGDFDLQTNACVDSVPIAGNCAMEVVFKPTATGTRDGSITIVTSAPDSPNILALSGNGTDFVLDVQSGGATSATVAAGTTAHFDLQIEPTGFVGDVSLGCAFQGSTPRGASCSVSPNVVALNGTDPGPFTVNVATTARSLAVPRGPKLPPAPSLRHLVPLLLGLTLLILVIKSRARIQQLCGKRTWAQLLATMLVVLLWSACGGGAGGGGGGGTSTGTPAGDYTLTLTATAGGVSKTQPLTLRVN